MSAREHTPQGLAARVAGRIAARVRPGQSVCAAFSGGLDSTVLLDLLAGLREAQGFALSALHVHHGLSRNADRWAQACEAFAAARGVPIRVERVAVARGDPAGLEAAARAARHAAFARAGTDFVALAHHRDDQAETVLLQALRGTGVKGLAALGEASNEMTAFDRNFLRHEVMPVIERRFPQYRESLARLARHAAVADELLASVAREDAARLADGEGLSAEALGALDPARRANVLRHFLAAHGLAMPGEARLAEIARQLVSARGDARVLLLHGGRAIVRHRGRVIVEAVPRKGAWEVSWHGERVVPLGEGRGEVHFEEGAQDGIAARLVAAGRWRFGPRAGGERIRLRPGGPTRTLKNLLQEHAIPAWRRGRLPLLFDGDRLVWVPGIGIAADYLAPGLLPTWHSGTVPLPK